MYDPAEHLNIKAWAEEDRPREKLLLKGKAALSDAELLAVLIGSGTRSMSAVDVGKLLLNSASNDLNALAAMSINELKKVKGIGEAKAITVVCALELGRRRKDTERVKKTKITSSMVAYLELAPLLSDLPHEEFWVLLLNRANEVMKKISISAGGVSATVVDPKMVFKPAIDALASSLLLFHNHPSGSLQPSQADIALTRKLKDAGKLLDIAVLDHLIVGQNAYYSFADEGIMP